MIVGADDTSEVVFREFIGSKEDVPTIYSGMPLHTEFRVFYDFGSKKAIGVSNYWNPEVMEKSMHNPLDRISYGQVKDKMQCEYNEYKGYNFKTQILGTNAIRKGELSLSYFVLPFFILATFINYFLPWSDSIDELIGMLSIG